MRAWQWIHKWTSLISGLVLLVLCLTGLPLIFADEISDWWDGALPYAALPADAPPASLDQLLQAAKAAHPGQIVTSLYIDDDEPKVMIMMAPDWAHFNRAPREVRLLDFDARTGALLRDEPPLAQRPSSPILFLYDLHASLFLGLSGEIILFVTGVVFLLSLISGVVLYAPFMRRLAFGTVRFSSGTLLRWLDLHNLTGIVLAFWMLIVGASGALNALTQPLFGLWQMQEARGLAALRIGQATPLENELAMPQAVLQAAQAALPGQRVTSLIFPGSRFGLPSQYLVWTVGNQTFSSRLYEPLLIDARTAHVTKILQMPWYLRLIEVSRPLHFGDYGDMPMKIIWALFDLTMIAVLISGFWLWIRRFRTRRVRRHAEVPV